MKAMQATSSTPQSTIKKDSTFWKYHAEAQASSKLSKRIYCRTHKINYDNFLYWFRKLSKSISSVPLVSVKLKQPAQLLDNTMLCTLLLNNGCVLHVHDQQALLLILERLN